MVAGYVISSAFFVPACACVSCVISVGRPGVALSLRRSLSCSVPRQSRYRSLVVFCLGPGRVFGWP